MIGDIWIPNAYSKGQKYLDENSYNHFQLTLLISLRVLNHGNYKIEVLRYSESAKCETENFFQ